MNLKKLLTKRNVVFLILFLVLFILFHTRKCYVLDGYGDMHDFPNAQLSELENTDSVLNIGQVGILFFKKNRLSFFVFSKQDFKTLTIKKITIHDDKKVKELEYGIVYDTDTKNPNQEKFISCEYGGKTVEGYYKFVHSDFLGKDKHCWINFYKLFRWRHGFLGDRFPITMTVDYNLDDREYTQELKFVVTCEKDYPSNLFSLFFGG